MVNKCHSVEYDHNGKKNLRYVKYAIDILTIHLIKQLFIHTGGKKKNCKVCNKQFTEKGSLNNKHSLIHTGEKPQAC